MKRFFKDKSLYDYPHLIAILIVLAFGRTLGIGTGVVVVVLQIHVKAILLESRRDWTAGEGKESLVYWRETYGAGYASGN